MLIYRITNLINGKAYTGRTRFDTPHGRWHAHTRTTATLIGQAIQQYGEENFTVEILISNPKWTEEILRIVERKLIRNTKTPDGYNMSFGSGGPSGNQHGMHLHPGRRPTGIRHGSHIHPERLARGERHGQYTHPERMPRGETHGMAYLTVKQVLQIRAIRRKTRLTIQNIADLFGIPYGNTRNVVDRVSWKHI